MIFTRQMDISMIMNLMFHLLPFSSLLVIVLYSTLIRGPKSVRERDPSKPLRGHRRDQRARQEPMRRGRGCGEEGKGQGYGSEERRVGRESDAGHPSKPLRGHRRDQKARQEPTRRGGGGWE